MEADKVRLRPTSHLTVHGSGYGSPVAHELLTKRGSGQGSLVAHEPQSGPGSQQGSTVTHKHLSGQGSEQGSPLALGTPDRTWQRTGLAWGPRAP